MSEDKDKPPFAINVFPESVAKDIVPKVYEHGLEPAVREAGKALQTGGKMVNAVLMPFRAIVLGLERLEPIIVEGLGRRLEGKDPGTIQSPPPYIAAPALQGALYSLDCKELREMFINLLASAMDSTRSDAHPAFVDVIKQLSPDEAKILARFFEPSKPVLWTVDVVPTPGGNYPGYTHRFKPRDFALLNKDVGGMDQSNGPAYLGNLTRLGLLFHYVAIGTSLRFTDGWRTEWPHFDESEVRFKEWLRLNPDLQSEIDAAFQERDSHIVFVRANSLHLTSFGKAFCRTCVGEGEPRGLLLPGREDDPDQPPVILE